MTSPTYTVSITTSAPVTLTITTRSLPEAIASTTYRATLTAVGGTPPYRWSIIQGTLPTGLTLDRATGVISGVPTKPGLSQLSIQVTDSATAMHRATVKLTLRVVKPRPVILPKWLTPSRIGAGYVASLTTFGGVGGYRYSIAWGTLPRGFTLSPDGVLAGTPARTGWSAFTVKVTDAAGYVGYRTYLLYTAR